MIDTLKLRRMLGWLGMLLPWIVVVLSLCFKYGFPQSISATYHVSTCITPFMIILGAAGLLLLTYNGYETIDRVVCSIAGIFALMICLFPTSGGTGNIGTFNLPQNISSTIHNISAFAFFGLLAFNSLFLFTKTNGTMSATKKKRNVIYKVCGIGMLASFLLLIPLWNVSFGIWLVEAIALMFFGISWLTKANCYSWLFKEKE